MGGWVREKLIFVIRGIKEKLNKTLFVNLIFLCSVGLSYFYCCIYCTFTSNIISCNLILCQFHRYWATLWLSLVNNIQKISNGQVEHKFCPKTTGEWAAPFNYFVFGLLIKGWPIKILLLHIFYDESLQSRETHNSVWSIFPDLSFNFIFLVCDE